jgi:tRNA-specific 2-thiouridylase
MAAHDLVIVGISGGVDSAVAALQLRRAGYAVQGLHMTNWDDDDACCSAAEDYQAARRVCAELGIPLHRADFSTEYRRQVFDEFLREYRAGRTPNPDVLCNRHIKFGIFLEYSRRLGAKRIATGHYARLGGGGGVRLLQAVDRHKDQTYFLHAVTAEALGSTLFPIGELTKGQVRDLANQAGLPNHDRPDSTGICFIGERPFRTFLARYLEHAPGPVITPDGVQLGHHEGLMFFTPGQRSGIGLGGRAGGTEAPWYVAGKDRERNALIVVQGRDHPLLWHDTLETETAYWINGAPGGLRSGTALRCDARIRHRHRPAACSVTAKPDGTIAVRFDQPQWAAAPGQYVVLYEGEQCLGGAVIARASTDKGEAGSPARAARPQPTSVAVSAALTDPL